MNYLDKQRMKKEILNEFEAEDRRVIKEVSLIEEQVADADFNALIERMSKYDKTGTPAS